MAEQHDATTLQDADVITPLEGAGSSKDTQQSISPDAPVNLPLRQQMHHQRHMPKIHDITEKFTKACSALEVGQLVKDEYFTLFESIGALEIMDPKMDSGFLEPGEALEDAYDTLSPLLPEEVIGIMDHLLCYEMAWHTGYPLSQTLFTSVYIDKLLWPEPKTLEEAQFYRGPIPDSKRPDTLLEVLRAYCIALIKCCDFVIAKIVGRDYFEEEDFCSHTYNRVLFVQAPMDVFLRELDAAVERIEDPDLNISANLKHALTTRLEFRKAFLTALDLDCPLGHLGHYWSPILASLTVINATQQVGKVVPGSFSTKIQRRLASTVPPRPIVELEFKDAFEKLKQLCIDCEEATRFTNLPADPLEYESFLWAYASRTPKPLPYSRAYLSTILFHPDILNSQTSPPLVDLKTLVLPCSPVVDPINWTLSPPRNPLLPKAPRLQMALLIDEFVERAGQNYLDFWTSLGQNRCRLRRMLTHVIAGWDQLQADAGLVDEDLMRAVEEMGIQDQVMKYPLTTWVYHKKLFMMEKTILLSFEQNIYLPDEFAGMYHFLSIIATKRRALLENILDHFNQRVLQHTQQNEGDVANEIKNQAGYIESLCNEASGIEHLSAALSKFYIALLYLKLLPHPSRPFSTEELRYELRMKPFLTLQPPEVPPFADFQASIEPFGPFTENNSPLLSEITNPGSQFWSTIDIHVEAVKRAFTNIKKGGAKKSKAGGVEMAWGKEIQGTLASCIALGIAVVGVKGALAGSDGLGIKVEVPGFGEGKRYHEGWVVGKVVKG